MLQREKTSLRRIPGIGKKMEGRLAPQSRKLNFVELLSGEVSVVSQLKCNFTCYMVLEPLCCVTLKC